MRLTTWLTVCALVGSVQAAQAQGTMRRLSGRVFDDTTGCPLANVQVAVLGGTHHAVTNKEGRYDLSNPPAHSFSVQAMLDGYIPRRADSVTVGDSGARVDFSLMRSGTTNGKTRYPSAKCHLEPTGAAADSGGKG